MVDQLVYNSGPLRKSYNNLLQSQTLTHQIAFSGISQICTDCPVNSCATIVAMQSSTEPLQSLQPFQQGVNFRTKITKSSSSLPPTFYF